MTDEPKKPEPAKPAAAAKPEPAKPAAAARPAAQVAKAAAPQVVAPPPWWRRLRADPPVPIRMALGGVLVFLVFLFWWIITHGPVVERIISPAKLPSPGEVWDSISLMGERHLGDSIFDTLQRVFLGVGIASLVGVSLGVVAASHRGVSAALGPLVIFLRSVPMGALLPLTLILFSTGEEQKIMFIFLAIVPFVFSDTMKAVSLVPERYVETAQTLGASRTQIILKVLVPLSIPDIITSIRFQVGLALGYIMLAEEIDTPRGLGQLIMGSEREGPREHVYLLLFIIALLAYVIDLTLRTIQRGAFTWRRDL